MVGTGTLYEVSGLVIYGVGRSVCGIVDFPRLH